MQRMEFQPFLFSVSLLKIQNHLNLEVPPETLSGSSLQKPELVPHLLREKWNKIEEKTSPKKSWIATHS